MRSLTALNFADHCAYSQLGWSLAKEKELADLFLSHPIIKSEVALTTRLSTAQLEMLSSYPHNSCNSEGFLGACLKVIRASLPSIKNIKLSP